MEIKPTFVQPHPLHVFNDTDDADYSERDNYFIQCLKAVESVIDIDAYIIDYKNERFLYATKNSSILMGNSLEEINSYGFLYYDKIVHPDDAKMFIPINEKVFDFLYSVPAHKRTDFYYTFDRRLRNKNNKSILVNHKITMLDLTDDGIVRLGLCVISYPTNDKPGNVYIKINNKSVVYQYMPSTNKFVEVKTQKLTSKAMKVLELASSGKTEAEIAEILKISIYTVKYHKKTIFAKIGVKNTTEAIQWVNNQKRLTK